MRACKREVTPTPAGKIALTNYLNVVPDGHIIEFFYLNILRLALDYRQEIIILIFVILWVFVFVFKEQVGIGAKSTATFNG